MLDSKQKIMAFRSLTLSIFSLLNRIYSLFRCIKCPINTSSVLFLQRERKTRQCYTLKNLHWAVFIVKPKKCNKIDSAFSFFPRSFIDDTTHKKRVKLGKNES